MNRITNSMLNRNVLRQISSAGDRVSEAQEKLATGRDLNRPSDDPFRVAKAMGLQGEMDRLDLHNQSITEAAGWVDIADTAMDKMSALVLTARNLVLQAANGTYSTSERQAMATQLDGVIESIKEQGNTRYNDQYIFAGAQTGTQPYAVGGADAYAGDAGTVVRQIGPGVNVQLNQIGSSLIGDGSSGLIAALRQASANITAGNLPGLQGDLTALDAANTNLLTSRAVVGELQQRFSIAADRLLEVKEHTMQVLSDTQDADYAETLMHFEEQRAAYTAALKAGAQILQPSLMDFLK